MQQTQNPPKKKDAAPSKSRALVPPRTNPTKPTSNKAQPQTIGQIARALQNIQQLKSDAAARAGITVDDLTSLKPKEQNAIAQGDGYQQLPVDRIIRSPWNREDFEGSEFDELVESVRERGVKTPVQVRPIHYRSKLVSEKAGYIIEWRCGPNGLWKVLDNRFDPNGFWEKILTEAGCRKVIEEQLPTHELIAGERRWRGSIKAGRKTIPAISSDVDDKEALELQAIENLQRKNLRPLDEAHAYQSLLDQGATVDELVTRLKRSKATIYGKLKLLELPESIQKSIRIGKIPVSHAELITRLKTPEMQKELAKEILSVDDEAGPMSFRSAKRAADEMLEQESNLDKYEAQKKEWLAKGRTVFGMEKADSLFYSSGSSVRDHTYAKLDSWDDRSNDYWKKVVDLKKLPPAILAITKSREPVEIYLVADLQKIRKVSKNGEGNSGKSSRPAAEIERERTLKEARSRQSLDIDAICCQVESLGDCDAVMTVFLTAIIRQCGSDQVKRTAKRRGLIEKLNDDKTEAKLSAYAANLNRKQQRALALELLLQSNWPDLYSQETPRLAVAMATLNAAEVRASGKESK